MLTYNIFCDMLYLRFECCEYMTKIAEALPKLTVKQNNCLRFIFDFYESNRFYPSHREIADALEVNTTNMRPYLTPLEKKGYITIDDADSSRNIRLTEMALEKIKLMESKRNDD